MNGQVIDKAKELCRNGGTTQQLITVLDNLITIVEQHESKQISSNMNADAMTLDEHFSNDLIGLIGKYEGMEMTNASAVGHLVFKAIEIATQKEDDDEI